MRAQSCGQQALQSQQAQQPPQSSARAAAAAAAADDGEQAARLIQNATAEAERIITKAQEEAQRITAQATGQAQAQARQIVNQAEQQRQDAERVVAEAAQQREQAAWMVERAQRDAERLLAEATQQGERILAEARAQARGIDQRGAPAAAHAAAPGGRAFVAIFFQEELAAATGGFADAQRVGGGGFGSVYTARLPGLGDEAAVHAVKKLDLTSMQGQSEFLQEVQVLGACRHENLLPLLGFSADRGAGQQGEGVCLVTPLCKGGSLEDRLFLDPAACRRLAMLPGAPGNGFEPLGWQQLLAAVWRRCRGSSTSTRRTPPRTSRRSCTATSSRATFCSTWTAAPGWRTWASRDRRALRRRTRPT